MKEIAYYQDRFVSIDEAVIPIQERGHQFGDGIYEVIRVYQGKPFYLDEHFARLQKSADAIELAFPVSIEEMKAICMEGLERSQISEAEIYLQITRGIHARQHHYPGKSTKSVFSMTVKQAKVIAAEKRQQGIAVLTTEDVRWKNCFIKSLNLLPNVMAKQKALMNDCDEAVLYDSGLIIEGSSSNVFAVKNNTIYTHPATNAILHGITRNIVLDIAAAGDIQLIEEAFTKEFLLNADEAFITSTTMEILPIRSVDGVSLPTKRPICELLINGYQQQIK